MHIDFAQRNVIDFVQEIFPFVEDIIHVRKRYPVLPEELEAVLERMYPDEPPQRVFWGTQICIHVYRTF